MEVNFPYVNVTKQHQGKMTSDLHFDYNILPNIKAPFIHRLQTERNVLPTRRLRELEDSLARLTGEQREVILLVGLEGMSYEPAEKLLSVPVGTVRPRLSRGSDALRRLMGLPEKAERVAATPSEAAPLAA